MEEMQPSSTWDTLKHAANVLLFGALWLLSVFLMFLTIFALREAFLWGLAEILVWRRPDHPHQSAAIINAAHHCFVILLGLVSIVVVIGGSEFAFRRAGKPGSLRVLLLIIAVECAIVLPVALAFWID